MKRLLTKLSFAATLLLANNSNAQYCEPNANCGFGDYIDGVEFNTISNTNTGGNNCNDGSYSFYESLSTSVLLGQSYDITLTPSNQYDQGFAVWIDFDQNAVFESDELVYSNNNPTNQAVTGSVSIPGNATTGNTQMRVRCRYNQTITGTQACTNFNYGETEDYVVNIVAPGPPTADFSANTTSSCNGWIQFENLSLNEEEYLWDFGDGNTSTEENPLHQYTSTGIYSVSLTVTNNEGNDTQTETNYINVDFSQSPVAAACTPETGNGSLGFGITSFSFNTITRNSADASEGYQDLVCDYSTTVMVGSPYNLSIGNSNNMSQNYSIYIDYNNDGDFNDTDELAFSVESEVNTGGTITISNEAELGTFLRMRVMSDYDFNPISNSCTAPQYGQVEDYSIYVEENNNAPDADFSVSTYLSCDGEIIFTDESLYSPDSWLWNFGDGNTSNEQNPTHEFTSNGTFTVSLIATNAFGTDTLEQDVTIDLDGNISAASCTPSTLGYCCEYGITRVILETINNPTTDGEEEYQDFSCSQSANLVQGTDYSISINTGGSNPHDVYVWVDMNNDGTFDESTELIYLETNVTNPSGTFTLPLSTNAVYDTKLRMRVTADFNGSDIDPCANSFYGQTEDYGLTILEPTLPPTADFEADITNSCNGQIQFTDLSNNAPNEWSWDFGDGNTSTEQNPSHIYESNGSYTVSLVATNENGSDTETMNNYITVNFTTTCDTIFMNDNMADTVDHCNGVIVDNGGENQNYFNNTYSVITITPEDAASVSIEFNDWQFELEELVDYVYIYDGPSTNSPLIGAYTGWDTPNFGDPIESSGGSITMAFESNNSYTAMGFVALFSCTVGLDESEIESFNIYPNPTSDQVTLAWSGLNSQINLQLVDNMGRIVHEEQVNSNILNRIINTSEMSEGVYYLIVNTESNSRTLPLIITK